jgi:hypothetical protein
LFQGFLEGTGLEILKIVYAVSLSFLTETTEGGGIA